eukprot:1234512-Pleurochrysis_carterae.AAC.3
MLLFYFEKSFSAAVVSARSKWQAAGSAGVSAHVPIELASDGEPEMQARSYLGLNRSATVLRGKS